MFILEDASSDTSWKYTFLIMMIVIFILCGIYTYIKISLKRKKEMQETIDDPNSEYTKAVLDNEEILLKKKND